MTRKRRLSLAAAILILGALSGAASKEENRASKCQGVEVWGICDPFVPGTIIMFRENQPILVVATWPDGPAERAGVCPGDEILAVNGISAAENTSSRMLKEIASDSPTAILLRVERDHVEMNFETPRVRESTLANLSKQKIVVAGGLHGGAMEVPINEAGEELEQLQKFQERIDRHYGFKTVGGFPVPLATPHEQIVWLSQLRQVNKPRSYTGFQNGPDSFSAGFNAVLEKAPEEVRIHTVLPDSPASRASLLPGDKLVEVDGSKVEGVTIARLRDLLFKLDERRTMSLKVMRGATTLSAKIETQKWREFTESNFNTLLPAERKLSADDYVVGIKALEAESPRDAIVARVEYPSPAFDAGLRVGDQLRAVNGKSILEIDRRELAKLLAPNSSAEISFEVSRLGKKLTFHLAPVTYRTALLKIGRRPTKFGPAPQRCPES